MQINQALLVSWCACFGVSLTVSLLQGDGMHNSGALLPDLVNDGIRLLLYAGEADMRM
jgi:hypothetical protein